MTKLPRDLSAVDFCKRLKKYGYEVSRQTGSHIRLTTTQNGEHHVTVPNHDALRVGTLAAVTAEVAFHADLSIESVRENLFG